MFGLISSLISDAKDNGSIDFSIGGWSYAGSIVGGVILGLGTGVVFAVIINGIFYTEINGKSIAGYIEDGIEGLLEWLF